jgi:hypothetical protein
MPKANADVARELARLSTDCSFLLTHLVRQNDGRSDQEAATILRKILALDSNDSPQLKASKVGWYSAALAKIFNPISGEFDDVNSPAAVCFTESTLTGMRAHRDVFGSKYGVAFDRDWLFAAGANPCLNIRESILKQKFTRDHEHYQRSVYNFIPAQLHPFVNIIHESFDATHEREWRHAGDLSFEYADLRFIFCPEADFTTFAAAQVNGLPCLFDLKWLDRV